MSETKPGHPAELLKEPVKTERRATSIIDVRSITDLESVELERLKSIGHYREEEIHTAFREATAASFRRITHPFLQLLQRMGMDASLTPDGQLEIQGGNLDATLEQHLREFVTQYFRNSREQDLRQTEKILIAKKGENSDSLTGLVNIRGLTGQFPLEIEKLKEDREDKEKGVGLLMVDLDNFKRVNDTYGQEAGNTVLKNIAAILQKAVRQSDIVSRYGGEEFVITLNGVKRSDLAKIADKIYQAIRETPIPLEHKEQKIDLLITASIGVTFWDRQAVLDTDDSLIKMVKEADLAEHRSKATGKDRITFYDTMQETTMQYSEFKASYLREHGHERPLRELHDRIENTVDGEDREFLIEQLTRQEQSLEALTLSSYSVYILQLKKETEKKQS